MKAFMDENFLLSNDTAVKLYHEYAKNMPIYDYHCHLSPKEIWENKKYKNITQAWLYGDHYKWRAMRSNGIDEEYITGGASDYDKFKAWAKTIPYTIGNPLYHWTHLELRRFFGVYELLNEENADIIWEKVNDKLSHDEFSPRGLIKQSNVKLVCTTDDPLDNLEYHQKIKEIEDFDTTVLPAFRPDKGVEIRKDSFKDWVEKLAQVWGNPINNYDDFLAALEARIDFFHNQGCRLSDHGLDYVPYREASLAEVNQIFKKALNGESITIEEEEKYKTYTLNFLGRQYSEREWAMQLHIQAMRNNNTKMFKKLGPDTGYDSMNDYNIAYPLSRFMDSLEQEGSLPRIILYSLNPKDNYVLASMLGNFQGDGIPGKIQFGSAWWFNDQKDGMEEQMKVLANVGLLSRFIGMLTDSRSFLSYTRHEYFRRILCNIVGEWAENGEAPNDIEFLGSIVQGICFNNAKEYFTMELK